MRGSVLLVALLLVALLLALAVVDDRPHAAPGSLRDGRITVLVGESGEAGPSPRLVVMDADGRHARLRRGWVIHASLSPDGRSIAYDLLGARDTRVIAADGALRDRVLVRDGRGADWAPDGHAIAFVRYRHGGCCGDADIWVEDLRSRAQRRVVRHAESPSWSPDGRQLAFVRRRKTDAGNEVADVWEVDRASGQARRLIRDAVDPRWSPDGGRISFERIGSFDASVYVARADGTAQRRVAEGNSGAWSPDGSELAIGDFRRVTRIRLDGTYRRVIYAPKGGCPACNDVDWAP